MARRGAQEVKRKRTSNDAECDLEPVEKVAQAVEDSVPGNESPPSALLALPFDVFDLINDELLAGSRLITRENVMRNPEPFLDSAEFEYRADILRPLTQTCRVLRKVYLPKYYEHVEACIVRSQRVWYKQLSERLEATSIGLTNREDLAKLVQVVTVSLTRCSTDTVLPAFATCLSNLPNLHTLRVMHAHSQMTTALKTAFEGKHYPQIRTIILPSCAHNILRACPGVLDVTCNEDDGSKLLSAIAKECKNVEVVEGFSFWKEPMIKRFVKAVPNLRRLNLHYVDNLRAFGKMPRLSELNMIVSVNSNKAADVDGDLENCINVTSKQKLADAREILAKSDVASGRTLTVRYMVRDFENAKNQWDVRWKLSRIVKFAV